MISIGRIISNLVFKISDYYPNIPPLKKVLIISYFYPPCNLTAANRIKGWSDHLAESGYYPVVVTRNWDQQIESPEDVLRSSGEEISHTKTEKNEVYALPYKASLRDRIFVKNQGSPIQKISRVLTFFNLIAENFWLKAIPHSNLYYFARKLIKENDDFHAVIISGNPFNQFSFGYHLNKEFGTKWIADYRDDWNTNNLVAPKTGLNAFIGRLQRRSERKWTKSAIHFISVSDHYVNKIAAFTGVSGTTIFNGYGGLTDLKKEIHPTDFVITYNGSLYDSQPIESFLSVIHRLYSEGYKEIKLQFPGLAFDNKQASRVKENSPQFSENVSILNRIKKSEVMQLQANSDLLLMLAYGDLKGIPSSKLYEYIGLEKEVLLFPSDNDVIEETLNHVGLGVIAPDENTLYAVLKERLEHKRNGSPTVQKVDESIIQSYSRKAQTKKLAELLDKIVPYPSE